MFTMHHIVSPAKTLLKSMLGKTSIVSDVLRTMRTSAACKFRYQIEMENQILHEIMEKNPNYSETVVPAPKEFRIPYDPQLNHNTFSTFYELTEKNLQERQHLGNGKFSNISNALSKSFPSASYEEIVNTLHCLCFWPETPTTYEPNFKRIWNSLDHECAKRMEQWNVPQKLLIADYWYHLSLSRISVYNQNMIKHLSREKSKLRNIDFVQLFFFINLQRSVPQGLFDSLESRLPSLMDKVSINEINIICLGYFKNESIIKNYNILIAIIMKLTDNLDEVKENNMVGVVKCLRKSKQYHLTVYYTKLLEKAAKLSENWKILTLVHMTLLSSTVFVYQPLLLQNVINSFEDEIHVSRLKDLSKLIQCLSSFNHLPNPRFNDLIFDEVLKESRQIEINRYFLDAMYIAVFYAYMGLYRIDVLKKIMSEDSIKLCRDTHMMNIAFLDYCIDIELEHYDGPRLKPMLRNYLIDQHRDKGMQESTQGLVSKIISNISVTASNVFGQENVCVRHMLPHMFNPDVVVRLNPKSDSLPLPELLSRVSPYAIIRPPSDETWVCLVTCGAFAFALNCHRMSGLTALRERQLNKLGYKTIMIPYRQFPHDKSFREDFLRKLMNLNNVDFVKCQN